MGGAWCLQCRHTNSSGRGEGLKVVFLALFDQCFWEKLWVRAGQSELLASDELPLKSRCLHFDLMRLTLPVKRKVSEREKLEYEVVYFSTGKS